jgi:mono/diheme cytochrome c family protein
MLKLALGIFIGLLASIGPAAAEALETAPADPVARGGYLANHVAMCVQCHSPHDRRGDLIRDQLFTGQAFPFKSPYPSGPKWAARAPALIRLPGWAEEDFVELLMTGRRPNGHRPDPPMPQFRMSREDARAIAAYLNSL